MNSVFATATTPITPKHQMEGRKLPSGWTIVEQLKASNGSSGGTFGVGYIATKGTEIAFVKVIDFVEALRNPDPMYELTKLLNNANFEKEVLEYCTARGMSRIMKFIGHEYIYTNETEDPMSRVSCLIMEAGEKDLRRLIQQTGSNSCPWYLQVMNDVALAITQLHKGGIAHLDIKPSNIIAVSENTKSSSHVMKVADLGRVVRKTQVGPFDNASWPGDLRYSPPEALVWSCTKGLV